MATGKRTGGHCPAQNANHPVIYYLCDHDYIINEILHGKGIKIAIIPFCCRDAFSIYKDRSLFDIVNTTGTEEQYVIDRYIRLIRQCMDEQVHLVIFPELALTPAAYAAIRQYLASCTIPHHIQLIICGSMWHARNNTAYILSGQGDEICHYNKLVPYTHEDNDSSDQRQIFEENLGEREEFHSFIDINGFGRLYFSICLDYLTSQYEPYQKQFGASVFFVAAYTPSLAKFRTHAANLAEEYQSISVLCNACSAIAYKRKEYQENNQIVGFISLTGKNDNERRNAVKFIDYQFDDCFDFCKANHAQCLKIMKINPMKIAQDQNGVRYADVQSYDAVVNIP